MYTAKWYLSLSSSHHPSFKALTVPSRRPDSLVAMYLLGSALAAVTATLTQQLKEDFPDERTPLNTGGETELGRQLKDLQYSMSSWVLPTEKNCSRETLGVLVGWRNDVPRVGVQESHLSCHYQLNDLRHI